MELRNSGSSTRRFPLVAKLRVRLGWFAGLIVLAVFGIAILLPGTSASSSLRQLHLSKSTGARARSIAGSIIAPPPPFTETISTFAANCTTPKTSFNLGETVCAQVSGAAAGQRSFQWANTVPFVVRQNDIVADSQADSFTLPTTNTSVVNGLTIDNRGTWTINSMDTSDGSIRATASFSVHNPASTAVDLEVTNVARQDSNEPAAGSDVVYLVIIKNNGPDSAASVVLTNTEPGNTTFVSVSQDPGGTANCTNPASGGVGTSTCTIASFPAGGMATLSFTYHVGSGTPDGTELTDTASISSTTSEKDSSNNSSTGTATVTTPTCTITPPADITQQNDFDAQNHALGGAVVTYADPTTSSSVTPSSCGTVQCTPASGSFFPVGVNTVTCSDTINGAVHFKVTIQDTEAPIISCPANVTAPESSHGSGSAVVDYPAPTASDNSGQVTVTSDPPSGSTFPVGTTTVTATATDAAGHTATCTFTVTVAASDCTIACPSNITQAPDAGQNGAIVNYPPATTTGTTCGTIIYSKDSGTFFPLGTTTVTATAQGGETCSFTVTVTTDTTPPTIACPNDIVQAASSGTCQANVSPGTPTANDDNPGVTVSSARSDGQPLGAPFPVGETVITWTATDAAGNTASCTQSVKITENVPPSVTAPAPITVNVNASCDTVAVPNFLAGLVASDNCTPNANLEVTQSPAAETMVGVGSHTVTITVKDISENTTTVTTTFNVVDNTAPTITLNGASSMTVECHTSFTDPGATASDACAGSFAATASGSVDSNTPGAYTITYNASDSSGNAATPVTRTVNVVDTTAPTIALNGASSVTVECHTSFTDPGATASDSCAGTFAATASGSVNVNAPGTYTVTYNASDPSGNAATPVTRTVNVVDTTAPTITLNGANPMTVECHTSFTDPGATASDSCDSSVAVTVSGSVNVNVPGTYTLTYNAHDASGNAAAAVSRSVTVRDTTPPTISCPANVVVHLPLNSTATSMAVTYPAVTGSDSCSSATVVSTPASGSVFPVGTTTVNATATDSAGNSSTCSFTVTVLFDFTGFFAPVNNPPTLNNVNAGRAIPVKFSLSGNKGLNIFPVGSPQSGVIPCDASLPVTDLTDTVTAGNSSLSYDAGSGQYIYVWKTESSWAGTCRQLVVTLNDGSVHIANFKFR